MSMHFKWRRSGDLFAVALAAALVASPGAAQTSSSQGGVGQRDARDRSGPDGAGGEVASDTGGADAAPGSEASGAAVQGGASGDRGDAGAASAGATDPESDGSRLGSAARGMTARDNLARDGARRAPDRGMWRPGGRLLSFDALAETIYERGFRRGYLRGLADARQRRGRDDRRGRPVPGGSRRGKARERQGPPVHVPGRGMTGGAHVVHLLQGGAIVILPPGTSPQALADALDRIERPGGGR